MKNFLFLVLFALSCLLPQMALAQYPENGRWQFGVKRGKSLGILSEESHYHVMAGWRFDRKRYLGLLSGVQLSDVGCDADPSKENGMVPFVPLALDYVRYVPFRKYYPDHSFFYGVVAGAGWYTDKLPLKDDNTRCLPFFQFKLGLDFRIYKRLGVNFGLHLQASDIIGLGCDLGVRF